MTTHEQPLGLVLDALRFASQKHRDQRRKDSFQSPYINHLIHVVDILWRVGQIHDRDVLVAAVLHDVIEDTETTTEEIAARFGENIAHLVQEVTDDKTLNKEQRKRLQLENAPHKSYGARLIKLADKTSNVHDIGHAPPRWPLARREQYVEWSCAVVQGLRGTHQALEDFFDQTTKETREILAKEQQEAGE